MTVFTHLSLANRPVCVCGVVCVVWCGVVCVWVWWEVCVWVCVHVWEVCVCVCVCVGVCAWCLVDTTCIT